ncbi:MAG: hypothetical protein IKA65_07630 [Lentisphaeria bacterium]|nr:hypothetical protein [Lentisphaeria bacterium]
MLFIKNNLTKKPYDLTKTGKLSILGGVCRFLADKSGRLQDTARGYAVFCILFKDYLINNYMFFQCQHFSIKNSSVPNSGRYLRRGKRPFAGLVLFTFSNSPLFPKPFLSAAGVSGAAALEQSGG